jgi:hypothetical protein
MELDLQSLFGLHVHSYTVICFVWVSAKFGTCTVVSVNVTLVEDKMRGFKGECAHFSFNKCPIYTHDSASAKFSTNSQEMDNSVYLLAETPQPPPHPPVFGLMYEGAIGQPR